MAGDFEKLFGDVPPVFKRCEDGSLVIDPYSQAAKQFFFATKQLIKSSGSHQKKAISSAIRGLRFELLKLEATDGTHP